MCSFAQAAAVSQAQRALSCLFYVFFSPPLFVGSFAGHFVNTIVPYQQPPEASLQEHDGCISTTPLRNVDVRLPRITFFTMWILLFNKYIVFTVRCTDTYINTDTACIQRVNLGLAQAHRTDLLCVQHWYDLHPIAVTKDFQLDA